MPDQPQFHRPYREISDEALLMIVRRLPEDDRLSSRINWEDKMTHAYAEIGIRMVSGDWNG